MGMPGKLPRARQPGVGQQVPPPDAGPDETGVRQYLQRPGRR
jgi:hypothetical protein